MKATAKAHTNIALIKYWGKRDDTLKLPMNNSLSLTLDALHTTTTVEFNPELEHDIFYLNDEKIQGISYQRVSSFLDLVREYGDQKEHALVNQSMKYQQLLVSLHRHPDLQHWPVLQPKRWDWI